MKLTYPVCCGVDVHKTFLVATIIKTDGLVQKYYKKRFSTFSCDLLLSGNGSLTTTARMSAWRARENTGFRLEYP